MSMITNQQINTIYQQIINEHHNELNYLNDLDPFLHINDYTCFQIIDDILAEYMTKFMNFDTGTVNRPTKHKYTFIFTKLCFTDWENQDIYHRTRAYFLTYCSEDETNELTELFKEKIKEYYYRDLLNTRINEYIQNSMNQLMEPVRVTLDDNDLNNIVSQKYSTIQQDLRDRSLRCMICMDDFNDDSDVKLLPCDGQHIFCTECIENWLKNYHHTCPTCKKSIGKHKYNLESSNNNDIQQQPILNNIQQNNDILFNTNNSLNTIFTNILNNNGNFQNNTGDQMNNMINNNNINGQVINVINMINNMIGNFDDNINGIIQINGNSINIDHINDNIDDNIDNEYNDDNIDNEYNDDNNDNEYNDDNIDNEYNNDNDNDNDNNEVVSNNEEVLNNENEIEVDIYIYNENNNSNNREE